MQEDCHQQSLRGQITSFSPDARHIYATMVNVTCLMSMSVKGSETQSAIKTSLSKTVVTKKMKEIRLNSFQSAEDKEIDQARKKKQLSTQVEFDFKLSINLLLF